MQGLFCEEINCMPWSDLKQGEDHEKVQITVSWHVTSCLLQSTYILVMHVLRPIDGGFQIF